MSNLMYGVRVSGPDTGEIYDYPTREAAQDAADRSGGDLVSSADGGDTWEPVAAWQ